MRIISPALYELESLMPHVKSAPLDMSLNELSGADVCPLADSPSQATKPLSSKEHT